MLIVRDIIKKQGDNFLLNNVSFSQAPGQKIAIAGETGSGKTTLVKIIAGLGQADSGEVLFNDKAVKGIHDKLMPGHKGIAYLSQHFELSNNYRVSELLAYANDLTHEQSLALYKACRIDHLLDRWAQTLSGGEKQRVALAKLLTTKSKLLVLDEPFSNLDLIHKTQLKSVLNDLTDLFELNYILVSHDAEDILPWADMILVMKDGELIQQGVPKQIYTQPETPYTAGLFGKYNTLPADLKLPGKMDGSTFLRPEDILITHDAAKGILSTINKVLYMGSHYELQVAIQNTELTIRTDNTSYIAGQDIYIYLAQS
jgi:ABC-type microcin C transport system duplicated ATPase subunit YejF